MMERPGSGFRAQGSGAPALHWGAIPLDPEPRALNPGRRSRLAARIPSWRLGPAARLGFSLAEMMVAIGILGVGLTMVACFFPVAIYQHADTKAQLRAMKIAQQAKDYILQPQTLSDPGPDLAYLGYAPNAPDPIALAILYNPRAGWANVIYPPCPPHLGDPPLYPGLPNPDFDDEVRYVWFPFAKRVDPAKPDGVNYFVAVTRRLPGERYAMNWGSTQEGSGSLFPMPLAFTPGGTPGGLGAVSDVELKTTGALPPDWRLIDVVTAGGKLISMETWAVYTAVSEGMTVGNSVRLRETLLPDDNVPVGGGGAAFIAFPPPLDGSRLGERSPYVMTLFF